MAYSQPPASALDFALITSGYAPPSAASADFELTTGGGIYYPPAPGVIKEIRTPWAPDPAFTDAARQYGYQVARVVNTGLVLNGSMAANQLPLKLASPFQNASVLEQEKKLAWDPVAKKDASTQLPHSQATPRDIEGRGVRWENASKWIDRSKASRFLVRTPWKDQVRRLQYYSVDRFGLVWRRAQNTPGQIALVVHGQADLDFQYAGPITGPAVYQLAGAWTPHPSQPKDQRWAFGAAAGSKRDLHSHLAWGPAGQRDTTLSFVYPDYPGPVDLPSTFTIPTQGFYVLANDCEIVRVSDGRDVPATSVSLSSTSDSYTWAFKARLAAVSARALVEGTDGDPVEVDVTINGNTWRILVDGWDGSESFAQSQVSISGRSRSAYLAAPYALPRDYVEGSNLLAQQLADQELPAGWSLDWNMTDWIIPAGAFQYQNLTPIEAISKIAKAGGGFVNVHPDQDVIQVHQALPASPWELDTLGPDFQIPHSVMLQRSSRKKPGQGVNGVYVMGGSVSPYYAEVSRRQTNGTPQAPAVVDPLITDRNPAEFRGMMALADTLRQSQDTYELPLTSSLGGLIPVGSLLEIGAQYSTAFLPEWRGIVTGVTVNAAASRAGNKGVALKVRQGLAVTRYYED